MRIALGILCAVLLLGCPAAHAGDDDAASAALEAHDQGRAAWAQGDLTRADALLKRAVRLREGLGQPQETAQSLLLLARVQRELGEGAEALPQVRRALDIARQLDRKRLVAAALLEHGDVLAAQGAAGALAPLEEALALLRALGDKAGIAEAQTRLARLLIRHGRTQRAKALLQEALALRERLGQARGVADVRETLAVLYLASGDTEQAREDAQAALAICKAERDVLCALRARLLLGRARLAQGASEEGRMLLEGTLREARRVGSVPLQVRSATHLARALLDAGEPDRALTVAAQGLQVREAHLDGSLQVEEPGTGRPNAGLYDVALEAALAGADADEVLRYTEAGRARSLRILLAGRGALRASVVPDSVRGELESALEALSRADAAYDAARPRGTLLEVRKLTRAVRAAEARVLEVWARSTRVAARQAALAAPRTPPLAELQAALGPGQTLVQYAHAGGRWIALVVRRADARVVQLGASDALSRLLEKAPYAERGEEGAADADAALAALRRMLVQPLGLPADTQQLLVCPQGPLSRVPFGALVDVPVTLVPSAAAFLLLRDEARGESNGVLAVGDPTFAAGSRFVPLPGTRAEVQAVGTHVLIGAEATETRVKAGLGRKGRWRAVHLASHALVNERHPMLSALVLAPDAVNDGRLSALEIARTRLGADLVVLSASRTALGRTLPHEGVVGLVRGVFLAGAPRVLGSLWDVDDAATRALMVEFYRRWSPEQGEPVSAAAALRAAQEHVRAQPPWRHPYYWAGWALWGLP